MRNKSYFTIVATLAAAFAFEADVSATDQMRTFLAKESTSPTTPLTLTFEGINIPKPTKPLSLNIELPQNNAAYLNRIKIADSNKEICVNLLRLKQKNENGGIICPTKDDSVTSTVFFQDLLGLAKIQDPFTHSPGYSGPKEYGVLIPTTLGYLTLEKNDFILATSYNLRKITIDMNASSASKFLKWNYELLDSIFEKQNLNIIYMNATDAGGVCYKNPNAKFKLMKSDEAILGNEIGKLTIKNEKQATMALKFASHRNGTFPECPMEVTLESAVKKSSNSSALTIKHDYSGLDMNSRGLFLKPADGTSNNPPEVPSEGSTSDSEDDSIPSKKKEYFIKQSERLIADIAIEDDSIAGTTSVEDSIKALGDQSRIMRYIDSPTGSQGDLVLTANGLPVKIVSENDPRYNAFIFKSKANISLNFPFPASCKATYSYDAPPETTPLENSKILLPNRVINFLHDESAKKAAITNDVKFINTSVGYIEIGERKDKDKAVGFDNKPLPITLTFINMSPTK